MLDRSAESLHRLATEFLEVMRLESGAHVLDLAEVDADQLLADCLVERERCAEAKVELDVRRQPSLPAVRVDRARIGRVFANLIDNAIKFAGAGSRITVSARCEDGMAEFAVSDDGPGLSPSARDAVFERRWQQQRDARGFGLGLAIVRGIVEAHGGRAWVGSAPNQGATFRFTVPHLVNF